MEEKRPVELAQSRRAGGDRPPAPTNQRLLVGFGNVPLLPEATKARAGAAAGAAPAPITSARLAPRAGGAPPQGKSSRLVGGFGKAKVVPIARTQSEPATVAEVGADTARAAPAAAAPAAEVPPAAKGGRGRWPVGAARQAQGLGFEVMGPGDYRFRAARGLP